MKKYLLFIATVLLVICGCGGNDGGGGSASGGNEYLNVSNVDIAGDQTSATLNIQASPNCDWSVSCNEGWVTNISPASGRGNRSVDVRLSGVNPSSTQSRTANITVRNASGSISRTVTLTQAANAEFIELGVSGTSLNFSYKAESREVTLRSNTHWTIGITGNREWITVTPMEGVNDGKFTVTVAANHTKDTRIVVLTFTATGGYSKTLVIEQATATAPTLTLPQVSNITKTEATVTFSYDYELAVSSYGICYGTTDNPEVDKSATVTYSGDETKTPTFNLQNLTPATRYFLRAYVIGVSGTPTYSNSTSFSTSSSWPGADDVITPN